MLREGGDVYDFMLFFNPYIDIFMQEIKTFKEKHKIIDVPYYSYVWFDILVQVQFRLLTRGTENFGSF
jgi:hypothetical protein